MANININSLRNKLEALNNSVTEYIHIIMAFETKLHERLPHALYCLKVFSNPHKLGKSSHGCGALLAYIRDNIQLIYIQGFFIVLDKF